MPSWSDYGGSPDSMGYSTIKQINKTNVSQLKLAWFVPAPGPAGRFSFNPLVIDGVMYVGGQRRRNLRARCQRPASRSGRTRCRVDNLLTAASITGYRKMEKTSG